MMAGWKVVARCRILGQRDDGLMEGRREGTD